LERYGEKKGHALANPTTELGLKYSVLFRSLTPAAPLESLPKRMLAFLFQFNDLCAAFAQKVERLPAAVFLKRERGVDVARSRVSERARLS
jgi:hypothetical protein